MKTPRHTPLHRAAFAALALGAVALLPRPLSAAVPADFAATRDIIGHAISSPRLVAVQLDAPLVAATQPDFSDLRLFDADLREIPRSIEPLYTTQTRLLRRPVSAKLLSLQEIPGNRIETRLDIAQNAPSPDGLEILTPLADFIRTVRVSGSDDGQSWHLLAEAEIYDYTRYMDIRRTEIPLPPNTCRHFAINISDASEERAQPLVRLVESKGQETSRALDLLQTPFRIVKITFWHNETGTGIDKPVLREWPHAGLKTVTDRASKTTEITLDTHNAPVTRLDLDTPARNFQRHAAVQAPALVNGRKTWRTVANGRLQNIDLPGLATNALSVSFPEQRAPQLRLVIQNADNPPIPITDVRPWGPIYRLIWTAEPAAAYHLAIGNEKLAPPDYDLFAIRAALEQGHEPELWTLGESVTTDTSRRHFDLGALLARPAVFGALLAIAALILLALLAKALKKTP